MNLYDCETNEQIALPCLLRTKLNAEWYVLNVDKPSGNGSSGKVRCSTPGGIDSRTFYPGVFGCYIANAPRSSS